MRQVAYCILLPACMSGFIEVLQAYCTTNRSGEWLDFAANCFGITLGFLVIKFIIHKLLHKKLRMLHSSRREMKNVN